MPSADQSGRFEVVRFRPEQAAAGVVFSEPRAGGYCTVRACSPSIDCIHRPVRVEVPPGECWSWQSPCASIPRTGQALTGRHPEPMKRSDRQDGTPSRYQAAQGRLSCPQVSPSPLYPGPGPGGSVAISQSGVQHIGTASWPMGRPARFNGTGSWKGGDTEHVPLGFLTTSAARRTWLPVADSARHRAAGNAVAEWSTAQRLNSSPP